MVSVISSQSKIPSDLDHRLNEFFPELLKLDSTKEMEKAALYREIKPEVERILNAVFVENFAPQAFEKTDTVRALAWNIERGNRFEGIIEALKNHPQLKDRDVLLLTELDYGMARSGNRFVARELARHLKLNYAFAAAFIALQ